MDFKANYDRKVNNFLISQVDEKIIANMVFVRSFELKSDFAIKACDKQIESLKFNVMLYIILLREIRGLVYMV